jgi:hypothetical protein
VTESLWLPGSTETLEVPELTFCASTVLMVTAINLPGSNENAQALESAEMVACTPDWLDACEMPASRLTNLYRVVSRLSTASRAFASSNSTMILPEPSAR